MKRHKKNENYDDETDKFVFFFAKCGENAYSSIKGKKKIEEITNNDIYRNLKDMTFRKVHFIFIYVCHFTCRSIFSI